jgi:hypothetical protein
MTHLYNLTVTQNNEPRYVQLISDSVLEQDEVLDLVLQACFSDINGQYSGLEIWGDHLMLGHPQPTDIFHILGEGGGKKFSWVRDDYRFVSVD